MSTSLERNTAAQRPVLFWFAHGKTSCHGILYSVWAPQSTVTKRTPEGWKEDGKSRISTEAKRRVGGAQSLAPPGSSAKVG